ncbi:MAG: DMT family transporter, partial [Chitinispirillaceae bacterium]|nr:DMT family transporter [Chitinispirillaceae bacterium]
MHHSNLGVFLALSASIFWTATPIFLASAGRRIGAYHVNILRLVMSGTTLALIAGVYLFCKGNGAAFRIPAPAFMWLTLSGFAGLVLGDTLYIYALATLGPRRTTLTITLAPIVPVVIAWVFIGEKLGWPVLAGIALIIGGIAYTAAYENGPEEEAENHEPGIFSIKGMAVAVAGTFFHGSGAVLARQAFLSAPEIDPVTATAVRVVSSAVIMGIVAVCTGHLFKAARRLQSPPVLLRITLGTFSGPVIGMIFYISAFKYTAAGIVTTLSGLSPVLILPVIALRYRVPIRRKAIAGA